MSTHLQDKSIQREDFNSQKNIEERKNLKEQIVINKLVQMDRNKT